MILFRFLKEYFSTVSLYMWVKYVLILVLLPKSGYIKVSSVFFSLLFPLYLADLAKLTLLAELTELSEL